MSNENETPTLDEGNVEELAKYSKPIKIDAVMAAFPAGVIGHLIPKMEDLPEEFRKNHRHNEFCDKAASLFYNGGKAGSWKEGIDGPTAAQHLQAVLGSYEPQHQHKMAAAGWLLSLWLEDDE